MKKIVSILIALSLGLCALAQNTMDRPMQAFPVGDAPTHIKSSEAWTKMSQNPKLVKDYVTDALKSGDREYSNAVLDFAQELVPASSLVSPIKKLFPSLTDASKADVLYWIGRNGVTKLQSLIDSSLSPGEAGEAAVFAAVQLGGNHNGELIRKLIKEGGPLAPLAKRLIQGETTDDTDETRSVLMNQK